MRLLVLLVLASTSLCAAEFTMKDGTKVNATVLKYTPGTIQLQSSTGVIKEFSEKQFKGESLARMLPKDNVYEVALSIGEQFSVLSKDMEKGNAILTNELLVAVNNHKIISKKFGAMLDLVDKYQTKGLLPRSFIIDLADTLSDIDKARAQKDTMSDNQNKHGIPQDVFEKIQASAKKEWPDDYSMQVWKIDKEVAAYKKLKVNE